MSPLTYHSDALTYHCDTLTIRHCYFTYGRKKRKKIGKRQE